MADEEFKPPPANETVNTYHSIAERNGDAAILALAKDDIPPYIDAGDWNIIVSGCGGILRRPVKKCYPVVMELYF